MKPQISYRKRRDLMLKNFSAAHCVSILSEVIMHSSGSLACHRGRPCTVRKERLIAFIVWSRLSGDGYERMEQQSECYLGRHYDHSLFQYHYTRLSQALLCTLTSFFERKIKELTNEILLHIADSTALSTSVREERLVQGTRNKVKLSIKFHTVLGYDPPWQMVVVEGMSATDKHCGDGRGAQNTISHNKLVGYLFGDSAYETHALLEQACKQGLIPVIKPTKKPVHRKLSVKAQLRKAWKGNPSRLYHDIRGTGEVLYGAATRAGIIHTHSRRTDNQYKDALIIGLRQNLFTYLRLKALHRIIRKTQAERNLFILIRRL